jgi:hypothetical protein
VEEPNVGFRPIADIQIAPLNHGMDEGLREKLCAMFDRAPASVGEFRDIVRMLVSHLSLSENEAEIMAWDAEGRNPAAFDRLRARAWDFIEAGDMGCRRRLFAGFVTTGEPTDGYAADYLIDFALGSGVCASDVVAAMTALRPSSSH